jgi:hypothetical protein
MKTLVYACKTIQFFLDLFAALISLFLTFCNHGIPIPVQINVFKFEENEGISK